MIKNHTLGVITSIRTNFLGKTTFNVNMDSVGEIKLCTNQEPFYDMVLYSVTRPHISKNSTIYICAENVTGVFYSDGSKVVYDENKCKE